MTTLQTIFTTHSPSPALINPSTPSTALSYQSLKHQITLFQSQLPKTNPQDVITLILPNSIEFTIAFLGITLQQNIAAPLNPNYVHDEFRFYMQDTGSKVVIVPKGWVEEDKPAVKAASHGGMLVLEIWWEAGQIKLQDASGKKGKGDGNRIPKDDDIALLLHTSGTTGRPKGVPLTHKNLTTTMKNIVRTYNLTPEDRTLLVMPLFHVHGLIGGLLSTLLSGGTVVIPQRFSATTFWRNFSEYRCTWYTAVPTIHQILLRYPSPQNGALQLRFIRSCSSSLAPTVLAQLEQKFKVPVLEAYAMTEAAHQMTSNPLPPFPHKPGSVGIGQGVKIAILDHDGNPTQEGEVCIKGNNVTFGYLNNPTANISAFTKDGWFRTGDQGRFDQDGYLFLTGRIKELINRGGEKISPLEIDGVLLSHHTVSEAVSFAVPDEMYGQEVHAAVVLKSGKHVTEKELQDFCEEKLVKFKVPKRIYFTDVMPKTATGKIQRATVSAKFFKSGVRSKL